MATSLSNEEIGRYSRHLIMPEVGMEGQLKLKNAKVLLIGTGGLGAPVAMYLAAAGVGKLGWWISIRWTFEPAAAGDSRDQGHWEEEGGFGGRDDEGYQSVHRDR